MASPPLHCILTTPVRSKDYFDKTDNDSGVAMSFLQMQQIRWKLFRETVEFQKGGGGDVPCNHFLGKENKIYFA